MEEYPGYSGGRADNRKGLQNAIDIACENSAALITYSLSRLSRSLKDTLIIADKMIFVQEKKLETGVRTGIITPANRLESLSGVSGIFDRCEQLCSIRRNRERSMDQFPMDITGKVICLLRISRRREFLN